MRGGRNGEKVFSGYRVSFWWDKNVLEMDGVEGDNSVNVLNATKLYT